MGFFSKLFSCFRPPKQEYEPTAIPGVVRLPTGKLKVLPGHHEQSHQPSIDQLEFLSIYANETVYGTPKSSAEMFSDEYVAPEVLKDNATVPAARFTVIRSHTMFVNGTRYHPYSAMFGYVNFFEKVDSVVEGGSPFDFCIYDEIERELQLWVQTKYANSDQAVPAESFPQSFKDKISEIESLCDDELVVEPMNKLEELRIEISRGFGWAEKFDENQRYIFLDHLVMNETMHRLRWKYPRVRNLVALIATVGDGDVSWTHENFGEIDTWTKVEADGSLSVRCRSVQEQALFNAISLIYEIDLHPQFMPHLAKSIKLHQILGCGVRTNLLLRYIYKLPMPFANRDIVLFAFGCNAINLDGVNGIIISAQSIPAGEKAWWGKPVPEEGADKSVREYLRGMNFVMKPLPGGKTELTVIANLDKQVAFIPKSVINWMIKDMIKGLYRNMIKLNKKFTETEFAKRVEVNPEFYNWVKQNIVKHNLAY